MRAVMVMYDSLDKHFLQPYGCEWTKTPNFNRLAQKAVMFDNFYVGSMPCMPARRELHTGRYNFLHRGWGPLEPFDDSMPEILKKKGIHTHMCTDHYHYLEDGGATYHNRYTTWELFRGQEGDAWYGDMKAPEMPELHEAYDFRKAYSANMLKQDFVNRSHMTCDADMPQSQTFAAGLRFIESNHDCDNWFLQIETFDPHEPFFTQPEYKALYPHEYNGKHFDWPPYASVNESDELVNHARMEYAALVSMCDAKLGLVLDAFDKYDLWKDTMLIVNTDHGFLLGEHEWWAKSNAPLYNEIANTPFFLYDPRCPRNGRCDALAQTIDIAPTLLDFFNVDIPKDMQGKPLGKVIETGEPIHDAVLYGYHSGSVCVTDGRYTYLRTPYKADKATEYTLMPTAMSNMFAPNDFSDAQLCEGFSFTKEARVMSIKRKGIYDLGTAPHDLLFDLSVDPRQEHNIAETDIDAVVAMCAKMAKLMEWNEAPEEQYTRMGLTHEGITREELLRQREEKAAAAYCADLEGFNLTSGAKEMMGVLLRILPPEGKAGILGALTNCCISSPVPVNAKGIVAYFDAMAKQVPQMAPFAVLVKLQRAYYDD